MAQPLLKPVLGSDDTDASSLDAIRDMMVRESEQRPKPAGTDMFLKVGLRICRDPSHWD